MSILIKTLAIKIFVFNACFVAECVGIVDGSYLKSRRAKFVGEGRILKFLLFFYSVSLRTVREAKAEPKAVAAALPRRGGYYRGRGGYHGYHGYHNHRGYGHRGYGHRGYGRRYGRSASLSKSFADVR